MVSEGMRTTKALAIAQIPRSTYYYKATGTRKGKAPSSQTFYNGQWVDNRVVVKAIEDILGQDFIDYGYTRTSYDLKNQGYEINKKKVYRLMRDHRLLYPKRRARPADKMYVSHSIPLCSRPFEVIEIDIKYIYIHGMKRHAYLITMLDVFTRMALVWQLGWKMRASEVLLLVNNLFSQWLIPCNIDPLKMSVKIRTDNGSQFIARLFRERLNDAHIENEYIQPGTPEQNGHIEAFHGTLNNLVCKKYHFDDFDQARETLERFFDVYNNKRIMASILYLTPTEFMRQWANGKIGWRMKGKKVQYFFREKPSNLRSGDSCSEILLGQNKFNELINRCLTHTLI